MMLTHMLALLWVPALDVSPQASVLAISDAGTLVSPRPFSGRAAGLLPALPVRAEPLLRVRGD